MSENASLSAETTPLVNDPARLSALQETELLDSPEEPSFDRLTQLVQLLLGVPVALVSLVDEDRQFFKSAAGLPEPWCTMRQTPLSHSFCQHVVNTESALKITDARETELVRTNLAIRDLNVIAYLGIPLRTPTGFVIGSLCAIDGKPKEWTDEHVRLLNEVAELVMTEIALRYELRLRERAQIELMEKAELLQLANESKDRFYSILGHDLRNPISSLVMMSQTLNKELDSLTADELREFIHYLGESAEHLHTLVENLMTWSVLQLDGLTYQPQWFDLEDHVNYLSGLMMGQVRQKEIDLTFDIQKESYVWADPDMIHSVLLNLLTNAIKFTESGGSVQLSAVRQDDRWVISVQDTGIGMSQDHLEDLFRMDQATSTPGTEGEKGTGLGLLLCKEMILLHGSDLEVESTEGKGTTFSFFLSATDQTED